ncbi:MAG: hypothetical protein K0R12_559 [Gammaproteobacteria bacterium]|jgi:hypothetical protein|nr:hypothetical protein [Gammaproteobacteria bacterium]
MKLSFVVALLVFGIPTVYAASIVQTQTVQESTVGATTTLQQGADFDLSSVIPPSQLFSDYRAKSSSSNLSAPPRKKVWSALSPVKAFAHLDEVEQSLLERNKMDLQSLSESEQVELRLVLDNEHSGVRRNDVGLLKRIGAAGLRLAYHY